MLMNVLQCCLVLLAFLCDTQAFWWTQTTTESPAVSVKHIPLTYFRTYTYQPLTGGPFSFPFGFGGSAQTPILSGGRYDQYTSNFPTNQHPLLPPQRPIVAQPQSTTTKAPTTPTTTTTTTTPAPTTTTTTSTTTTTTSTPSKQSIEPLINSGGGTFGPVPQYEPSLYPTYNRRNFINNYDRSHYRPNYPYPDYATTTRTNSMFNNLPQRPQHVQFVPCMCPVSVGVPNGLPIAGSGTDGFRLSDPARNIYIPQSRSNDNDGDDDSDMNLPLDEPNRDFNKADEAQFNDDTFLSDDSQSIILETNKIDSGYRKPKVDEVEVISS